ncbi:MAG: P-loop NTPase [Planctomycetes bacterium]|nr:P-loop NTPase [Planctomycetota bacterium]
MDTDLHQDIVSLGFIKNLAIDGGRVSLDVQLTTPACPIKGRFQREAGESVSALPGVTEVAVRMTSAKKRSAMDELQDGSTLKQVDTVIAISSCKGGVGKSTVAAHIALEIARRGHRVGLLDADLYGPSVPTLFGIGPSESVVANPDKQLIPLELGVKLMSIGFCTQGQSGCGARPHGESVSDADHYGVRFIMDKSLVLCGSFQLVKCLGLPVVLDGQVGGRGSEVLPQIKQAYTRVEEVVHDLFHFFTRFAETHVHAGLEDNLGMAFVTHGQKLERPVVIRAASHTGCQAFYGLEVVAHDLRLATGQSCCFMVSYAHVRWTFTY